MKKIYLVLVVFCFILLISSASCLGEERSLRNCSLSIGLNRVIPIFGIEKENEENWAYNFWFGTFLNGEGPSFLVSTGGRFINGDSGSRPFERFQMTAYGSPDLLQYRLGATYGYEWVLEGNHHSIILEGGLGVDNNQGTTVISPVIGLGFCYFN